MLRLLTGIAAALSFIATSLIVLSRAFPSLFSVPGGIPSGSKGGRSAVSRLVFFLILNDWALSVTDLTVLFLPVDGILPFERSASRLCIAQGFLVQVFTLSSYLWPFTLALHALLTVVLQLKPKTLDSLVPVYVTCNLFLPLVPAAVALALRYYGLPDPYHTFPVWCWVRSEFLAFRMGALYGPFVLIWLLSAAIFLVVIRALRQVGPNLARSATRRIVLYLAIFLLAYLPGFLNRSLDAFGIQYYWLYALQCVCDPLVGLADCVVYTLPPSRRLSIAAFVHAARRICPLFGPRPDQSFPINHATRPSPALSPAAPPRFSSDSDDPDSASDRTPLTFESYNSNDRYG